ncbi:glucosamine-6-phosphate deaminase [Virgibacillus flavescens]|uniref:glucosamine-6-phosphate deaminase n=1 Tax=Virgibacillus flavescens TaxID=1611422 RepID=UPI003D351E75
MKIVQVKDYNEMSEAACSLIIREIHNDPELVLGLATGSTPEGLYKKLIEKYNQEAVSFKAITSFNLDEYIGLSKDNRNSYHFYMENYLFQHIDINMQNVYVPTANSPDAEKECSAYEKLIRDNGKIDLQILGLGTNGHIGFNEPGTKFSSRTHIVNLAESTRKANARFFETIENVPTSAITMGIKTIMESREIIILVSGERKAKALARFINGEISEHFPASILKKHDNVTVIADEAAMNNLK